MTIRRKTWQAQLGNCQNRNSHTSNLLPVSLRNSRPTTFPSSTQSFMENGKKIAYVIVLDRMKSNPKPKFAPSEIRISLPPNPKSTLISYISIQVFVTTREKICPSRLRHYQNRILHTSNLFPVCLRNNSVRNNHISERHADLWKNCGRNCSTTDQWTDTRTDRAVSARIIP